MGGDESYACASAAAIGFGKSGARAYDSILRLYREREAVAQVAPGFLQALVETGEARAWAELIRASVYGKHPWLRRRAVEQLVRKLKDQQDEEGFKTLLSLLEDKSFHMRRAAIGSLEDLGDPRAVEALEKRAATEPDARIRGAAAAAVLKLRKSTPSK